MTTLLQIAVSIAEETGFQPSPDSLIGSFEETHKRLLRAIKRGGEMTAREHNWTILQKEHTFSTVDAQETYTLPAGFKYLLEESAWNRTNYWQMRGSLSPYEWQIRKSALGQQVGLRDRFRLTVGDSTQTVRIDPVPSGVEDLVLEYVTKYWIASGTKSTFTDDSDEPDIDAWLVELGGLWVFKRSIGAPYADERADWKEQVDLAFTRDGMPTATSLERDPATRAGRPIANVPDTGFGA